MAENETTSPPTETPSVGNHHRNTGSAHSSNDEKASPAHEHEHEHRDDKVAPETEELNDLYDPNVYVRALCHSLAPIDTDPLLLDRTHSLLTPAHLRRPTN
jgi:hypothetical protein